MARDEILQEFYKTVTYKRAKEGWSYEFNADALKGNMLARDLIDAKTNKVVATAGTKMTPRLLRKLADAGIARIFAPDEDLVGRFLADDFVNMQTGEVLAEAGDEISEDILNSMVEAGEAEISVLFVDNVNFGPHLRNTLAADRNNSREEAPCRHLPGHAPG